MELRERERGEFRGRRGRREQQGAPSVDTQSQLMMGILLMSSPASQVAVKPTAFAEASLRSRCSSSILVCTRLSTVPPVARWRLRSKGTWRAHRRQLEGQMGLGVLMGGCATYQGAWGTSGNGVACMAQATGGLGQKAHGGHAEGIWKGKWGWAPSWGAALPAKGPGAHREMGLLA